MTKLEQDKFAAWIEMINDEGRGLSPWETSFMESVTEQWERSKFLTDRQQEIIERIYSEKTP